MSPSLLSAALVDHFTGPVPKPQAVPEDLLAALLAVPDPRARRGVRHRVVAILGIAVCAVLAGVCSYVAIGEWCQELPAAVRLGLGLGRRAPCESTIRRVLQRLDPAALDGALAAWLAARAGGPGRRRRVIAVDGKTTRGARTADGRAMHLLAAFDTAAATVLGQAVVDTKTNEISAFTPLLDRIDITGAVITADVSVPA